jgi:serine phosphatase RsbU (regulator of sigma subunit)
VTEAQNAAGEFFGKKRLREIVTARAAEPCQAVHDAIQAAVTEFTEGAPQSDDITLVVLEFRGADVSSIRTGVDSDHEASAALNRDYRT